MESTAKLVLVLVAGALAGQLFFSPAQAQQAASPSQVADTAITDLRGEFVSGLHARLVSDGVDSIVYEVPDGKALVLRHLWIPTRGNASADFRIDRGATNALVVSLAARGDRFEWKGPGFRIEAGESLIVRCSGEPEWLGYSGVLVDA